MIILQVSYVSIVFQSNGHRYLIAFYGMLTDIKNVLHNANSLKLIVLKTKEQIVKACFYCHSFSSENSLFFRLQPVLLPELTCFQILTCFHFLQAINKSPANNTEACLQHEIQRLTGENFDLREKIENLNENTKRLKRLLKLYMKKLTDVGGKEKNLIEFV